MMEQKDRGTLSKKNSGPVPANAGTRSGLSRLSRLVVLCVTTVMWMLFAGQYCDALAHESQPGTLEIQQVASNRYEVTWRAPIYYGLPHPARLELPDDWKNVVELSELRLPDSQVFRYVVTVGNRGVEGSVVRFPGLEKTVTVVFVRLNRIDGTTMTAIARPSRPFAQLRGKRAWYVTADEYVGLGLHHIIQGIDHLLFILGLLLIVNGRMTLLKTITAFTIAHSITLGIATLGYARAPLLPLNAAVALSILFLGPEIVRIWRGETSLTIRYPWIVAFLFGLLHGFGFASGLSTAGMPKAELPTALFFFNVGVEMGQLVFVFTALALAWSFRVLEVGFRLMPSAASGRIGQFKGRLFFLER
jgi:hypothetical protein